MGLPLNSVVLACLNFYSSLTPIGHEPITVTRTKRGQHIRFRRSYRQVKMIKHWGMTVFDLPAPCQSNRRKLVCADWHSRGKESGGRCRWPGPEWRDRRPEPVKQNLADTG